MKKIMPLAASIALILIAGMFAGAGSLALFSDTETVGVHDIQAGTLDLTVTPYGEAEQNPCKVHIKLHDIYPGWKSGDYEYVWILKNTGSIPGKVSVEISKITNNDNGGNEPERKAERKEYGSFTGGAGEGELGLYLDLHAWNGEKNKGYANYGFISVGGQTGYDSKNNVEFGLNALGDQTYNLKVWDGVLGQDEFVTIRMSFSLRENLIDYWRGYERGDPDDNIIQSDSVEFDIIFHLDQVTP